MYNKNSEVIFINHNCKKIIAGIITALLSLIFIFSVSAKTNIALECEIDSFCCESENNTAAMLVDSDENFDTKWHADNKNHPAEPYYHWIVLDFGSEKVFDSVRLTMASQGAADFGRVDLNAGGFKFEISSDKEKWVEIFEAADNEDDIFDRSFPPVKARYLKLTITKPEQNEDNSEKEAARLYDLKVFEYIPPFDGENDENEESESDKSAEIEDNSIPKAGLDVPQNSDSIIYFIIPAALSLAGAVIAGKIRKTIR